jgi:DNA-binding IclR family transcriptional regulator
MSDSVSSLKRMLSVLSLFTDQQFHWSANDIASALDVSVPTAYRYLRLLVEENLLQRVSATQFALGAKIIVLDHYIRQADPVLRLSIPVMQELVQHTGFDCVLTGLYGNQLIDTHREYGNTPAPLGYGRGRPRPQFLGAAPKVILANLPTPRLRQLFAQHSAELPALGLPNDWTAFRRHFSGIRRQGCYLSIGELEPHLAAVAAPLQTPDGSFLGAIGLVSTVQRMELTDTQKLSQAVIRGAQLILQRTP